MIDIWAAELSPLIRWEPGMRDTQGRRVATTSSGYVKSVYADGHVYWSAGGSTKAPDLWDPSTTAILWGQLRRRVHALELNFIHNSTRFETRIKVRAIGRDVFDSGWLFDAEALLAGFRKVAELEYEAKDDD